jgi:hypothetical protein
VVEADAAVLRPADDERVPGGEQERHRHGALGGVALGGDAVPKDSGGVGD